jgi:hypothetical protein
MEQHTEAHLIMLESMKSSNRGSIVHSISRQWSSNYMGLLFREQDPSEATASERKVDAGGGGGSSKTSRARGATSSLSEVEMNERV